MVLELRGKNERVARNKRKPMVSNFMILGQPVTWGQVKHPNLVNWDGDLADATNQPKQANHCQSDLEQSKLP